MLIIISGLPGTGKTTFANALSQKLSIAHFNSDIIRNELGKRGQYDAATKALIYQYMENRTKEHLQNGEDVIVDATFYKADFRLPYLQLAEQYQIPVKWIEMKAGAATIKQRVNRKRADSEADFAVYQKIKKGYEPLSINHLVLSSDELNMEEMLDRAVAYLRGSTFH